jgi:cation diffusion facilitator CzcD-associated flavoprotein CzcO
MLHPIVIIGAGFSGLGMGIRLKQAGIHDFVILERADEIGGTWRDNHYPGAGCDVESHLYSFSFEPNPRWSRTFAGQAEILEYLQHCTEKYGLRRHIRLGTAVTRARFDERTRTWDLTTADGQNLRASVLIMGCGFLNRERLPDIPGLATFAGKTFHSSRWDRSYTLRGKRVAVIGTGASAIQIVPSIAPEVEQLYVFQRTPPWIVPKADIPIPPRARALYARFPVAQKLTRQAIYWQREMFAVGMVVDPRFMKILERLARLYLARSVASSELRQKLLPSYTMGCKRILPTNDWYRALQRENVELVTEPIAEMRPGGIATRDGTERAVDAVVMATGFEASEHVAPFEVRGAGKRDLAEEWRDGAEAYLGTTISGFPNLFLLVGPNTGLGHSSMIFMIESQVTYVLDAIRTMRKKALSSVEVRADAQARYNREIRRRLEGTVWATGCMSWYLTSTGRNTTLWPGFTFEFRLRTRRFDEASYDTESVAHAPAMTTSSRSLTFT